ncbi:MAG: RagB/SusD family nutrient uptake outer membrane protein [Bacteroidota bacterium]
MKNIFNLSLLVLMFMAFSACDQDEFLEVFPEDTYTSDLVYKSEADMILAVNGLYTYLPFLEADQSDQRMWFWSDDGWRRRGRFGSQLDFTIGDSDGLLNFYQYGGIRQCNEVISRIPDASFETSGIGARLEAEARVVRAMLYERMVFLYGDVPLVTTPQNGTFFPSRDARATVFDFVVSELQAAADVLPESYSGNEEGRITKWAALALLARANLDALGWHSNPTTLYDEAEAACRQIIEQGGFMLDDGIDGFERLFVPDSDFNGGNTSSSVILSRVYLEGTLFYEEMANKCLPRGAFQGTGEGSGNNQGQYGGTWNLISAFQTINGKAPADELGTTYFEEAPYDNMDPRLRASFILPGDALQSVDGGGTGYYVFQPHPDINTNRDDRIGRRTAIETGLLMRKYSGLGIENDSTLIYENPSRAHADFKIIRYAEVLLMMAECRAADNSDETFTYLNQVRNRVGMPSYNSIADVPLQLGNGTTGNNLIDAVLLERRYEFAGEGFQRMSDIWRYRLGDQVFGVVEGISTDAARPGALDGERFEAGTKEWDDRNYLLPLPQSALDINPNLTNNPGW